MSKPEKSFVPRPRGDSEADCAFGWNGQPAADAARPLSGSHADSGYLQARRQGIYLAACIVDEVAALGVGSPQAVIDEIRRRICELVRRELSAAPDRPGNQS